MFNYNTYMFLHKAQLWAERQKHDLTVLTSDMEQNLHSSGVTKLRQ